MRVERDDNRLTVNPANGEQGQTEPIVVGAGADIENMNGAIRPRAELDLGPFGPGVLTGAAPFNTDGNCAGTNPGDDFADPGHSPGDDCGPGNDVVRTQQQVQYVWSITADNFAPGAADLSNVVDPAQTPVGALFAEGHTGMKSGRGFYDWSARDLQAREMSVGLGPAKGKDFASSIGPAIVTLDELTDVLVNDRHRLAASVMVNDEVIAETDAGDLHWTLPQMIEVASRQVMLEPGDLIGLGTMARGCLLEQGEAVHPWLREGDEVVLSVERLGRLRNRIGS